MSLATKRFTLALLVLSFATAGALFAVQPTAASVLPDHYRFYSFPAGFLVLGPVTLSDQFGTLTTTAPFTMKQIGVPSSKNGSSIANPFLHYTWYDFNEQFSAIHTDIVASHQFGEVDLTLLNPVVLLAPALKNPSSPNEPPLANHYLCYASQGPSLDANVVLGDQFGLETDTLLEPFLFCNPTEKQHAGVTYGIIDPNLHYTCYVLSVAPPVLASVIILDQFFLQGVFTDLDRSDVFCLPSQKNIPVQVKDSSWGRVKTIYR